jgi:hypothetical protein
VPLLARLSPRSMPQSSLLAISGHYVSPKLLCIVEPDPLGTASFLLEREPQANYLPN